MQRKSRRRSLCTMRLVKWGSNQLIKVDIVHLGHIIYKIGQVLFVEDDGGGNAQKKEDICQFLVPNESKGGSYLFSTPLLVLGIRKAFQLFK